MAADHPTDILENILSRLPVKSLLRFKSVCRSWNTIISHPGFVVNSDSQNLFFLVYGYGQLLGLRLGGPTFVTEGPFNRRNESTRIMCFADGIVLLRGQGWPKGNWTYALWNPCTRKEAALPPFPYEFHQNTIHGLCHDTSNNDFKVVIGFRLPTGSKSSDSVFYSVFSSKEGSWTEKRDFPFPLPSFSEGIFDGDVYDSAGVSVDGAIYWILGEEEDATSNATRYITYFDPRDNSFKILQKPENDLGEAYNAPRDVTYFDFIDNSFKTLQKKPEDDLFYLAGFKGRLYLCCCDEGNLVRIWLKENGSWKMLINFDDNAQIWLMERKCWKMSTNIDNVGNEELQILIRVDERSYLIYNHCDKTCRDFGRTDFFGLPPLRIKLYPYGATMFFPPLVKTERRRKVLN